MVRKDGERWRATTHASTNAVFCFASLLEVRVSGFRPNPEPQILNQRKKLVRGGRGRRGGDWWRKRGRDIGRLREVDRHHARLHKRRVLLRHPARGATLSTLYM